MELVRRIKNIIKSVNAIKGRSISMTSIEITTQVETMANLIRDQFTSRTEIEGRRTGKDFRGAKMDITFTNGQMWITVVLEDEAHTITVPIPYIENGVELIKSNEVKRSICKHFDVTNNIEISYLDVIQKIFIGDPIGLVTNIKVKKSSFVQQIAYSILNKNTSIIIYNLQKAISEIVNKMPLHETFMNSYIMNQRLMMVDPVFNRMSSPQDLLDYQTDKNKYYFNNGWTSVGLSDGTLANKNYILKKDIKALTVFGIHHHNPQRNLFSTLGMRGDELPQLRSASAQELIESGITRTGWNLFTLFADVPDNFEDQVLVDISHKDKAIISERRFQCFGEILVKEGQRIKLGDSLVKCSDGEITSYQVKADESWIHKIIKSHTVVGGVKTEVYNVLIKFKRFLKDATKLTNTHGNKGVIRLFDLGYAIDPATGKPRKIDVIVSAKSVKRRKNYGQIFEALVNVVHERNTAEVNTPEISSISNWSKRGVAVTSKITSKVLPIKPLIYADNYTFDDEKEAQLKQNLIDSGIPEDGTWRCDTYVGEIYGVCGTVFWGVTKEPEDQLWAEGATERTNGKDLRVAGLKFSTVEFKALETHFGIDNAVSREVLSYTQGIENIDETLQILRSQFGIITKNVPTKKVYEIKSVDQSNGTIFTKESLLDTVADENMLRDGFILHLPVQFQTAVGIKNSDSYEGAPVFDPAMMDWSVFKVLYTTDKIYIPEGSMRRNWRHSTGMYGMSEIAVLINNIIMFSNNYLAEPNEAHHIRMLYNALRNYFFRMSSSVGTKKGDVSSYAMSVRYPYSAKAVATLSTTIPPQTIQIHSDMANSLKVTEGDVVIVERFPCLGFMGIRPQKVTITDDPMCKYTIRASGNSLVSTNLDFDGDVIYIAAFHTPEAVALLQKEWLTPNPETWKYIDQLNKRKGEPCINLLSLPEYEMTPFTALTCEDQAGIVRKLTGVKAQTGPVIAMAYNIMRIMENSGNELTNAQQASIEMFIEKTGQSVFEQKHGGISLCEIVLEAVCTGDIDTLVKEGYDAEVTTLICKTIDRKAKSIGINDLKDYHYKIGIHGSNIVNRIVKTENKVYFASRSDLDTYSLLECLSSPVVDLPSRIFALTMSGKYNNERNFLIEEKERKMLSAIKDDDLRKGCTDLFGLIDKMMGNVKKGATISSNVRLGSCLLKKV